MQVRVGNTTYYVGELALARSGGRWFVLSVPFTGAVAAASGVLLTLVVVICVAYRRKSRESRRIVRRMQTQMDALEARVANECKEGLPACPVHTARPPANSHDKTRKKTSKFDATGCQVLRLKCTKFDF